MVNYTGKGNSLQYSCLENPVDRGAWWAAVHGVTQSQTQLKRLSMHACNGEGNGNPLQYSCLESQGQRSLVGCCLWGHTGSDTAKVTQQQQQYGKLYTYQTTIKKKKNNLWKRQSYAHSLANATWPQNNGPWGQNSCLLRDKEAIQLVLG